ncbi:MAG: hypothetical protein H0W83_18550 [Planctomycetes bacterium]|nr:hypothetical protein [Planctomycetota bacterium]
MNTGSGGPEEYRTHLVVDGVCGTVMGYAFRPLMAFDARVTGRDTLLISHQQGRVMSILHGYLGSPWTCASPRGLCPWC